MEEIHNCTEQSKKHAKTWEDTIQKQIMVGVKLLRMHVSVLIF